MHFYYVIKKRVLEEYCIDAILSFFSYTLLWLHSKRCDLCWAYDLSENKTKTSPQ